MKHAGVRKQVTFQFATCSLITTRKIHQENMGSILDPELWLHSHTFVVISTKRSVRYPLLDLSRVHFKFRTCGERRSSIKPLCTFGVLWSAVLNLRGYPLIDKSRTRFNFWKLRRNPVTCSWDTRKQVSPRSYESGLVHMQCRSLHFQPPLSWYWPMNGFRFHFH